MSSSLNSVSEPLAYNVRRARVQVSFLHAVLLFCLLYGGYGGYGGSGLTLHGQQATTTCQDPLSYWDEVNPLIVTDEERVVSWEKDKDGSNSSLCFVYSDRNLADIPLQHEPKQVLVCSADDLHGVISMCHDFMKNKIHLLRQKRSFNIIFPGTLWCGPGNAATGNRKKLGFYAKTDSCCRAHDHCSPFIKPSTYDNVTGLYNEALISFRFHCKCDHAFKSCLRRSPEGVAAIVGGMYFNVFSNMCFDLLPDSENQRAEDLGSLDPSYSSSWQFVSPGRF